MFSECTFCCRSPPAATPATHTPCPPRSLLHESFGVLSHGDTHLSSCRNETTTTTTSSPLFSSPVSRIHCESESFKMDLILDVNIQIYPVDLGEFSLFSSLCYRPPRNWSEKENEIALRGRIHSVDTKRQMLIASKERKAVIADPRHCVSCARSSA